MYRRGYGRGPMYYPPQQVDPSIVSFGQVQLYDPEHYDRIGAAIKDSQARYDASQAAIAQHISDMGSADIEERHRNEYMAQMHEGLEKLYSGIMKDYDGDVGRASARIIQNLSSDRGLMSQLVQDTAREREAFKEYQQLKIAGKAPRIIDMEGNVREKSFEEYHNLGHFDSSGNFIRGQFTPLRGSADVSTYVSNNITKALNEHLQQGGLSKYKGEGIEGMLEHITRKGYTQGQLSEYFSKNLGNGITQLDQITDQLLKDVPGFIEEFEDMSAEERHEAAKKYVEPIIRNQVHSQYQRGFLQDPSFDKKGGDKIPPPIRIPNFEINSEANSNAKKILRRSDKAIQAADKAETSAITNKVVMEAVQPEAVEASKEAWSNAGTEYRDEMRSIREQGDITVGQRVGLFFSGLYRAYDWSMSMEEQEGAKIVTKAITDRENDKKITNEVAKLIGGTYDVVEGTKTFRRAFDVDENSLTPEQFDKRQAYLRIAYGNTEKLDDWGLTEDGDGNIIIDFENSSKLKGYKFNKEGRKRELLTEIGNYIRTTAVNSASNLEKAKNNEYKNISKLAEDNPIIPYLTSLMVESGLDFDEAKNKSLQVFKNTKLNESIRFDKTKPIVYTGEENSASLEKGMRTKFLVNSSRNRVGSVKEIKYKDSGEKIVKDKSFNDTIAKIKESDIEGTFFDLNDFTITIVGKRKEDSFEYNLPLENALPDGIREEFVRMKAFIDNGRNMRYINGSIDTKNNKYDVEYEEPLFISPDGTEAFRYSLRINDKNEYESVLQRYDHTIGDFVEDRGYFEDYVYGLITGAFIY